ncbi:MAG TPA: TetR/AcrR family transcriptional regulator [Acidothermales bacterium]|jgi:AcrR family transcriptional regulator|nr:TetR/AcrR family transcriptional regulator [Actinomycetes bacterium]
MLGSPTVDWQTKRREVARSEILSAAWDAARENGLAAITLRDVAARVGMQAPSLYSYFDSKHAIYDAMFGQAWSEYDEIEKELEERLPASPRAALKVGARAFFEFCVTDPARHQLMNLRLIPNFTPSPESYAPSVRVFERLRRQLSEFGVTEDADVDLMTAVIAGLIDQQLANDPGGDRWGRLLDRAMDMYADQVGLP